MLGTAPSRLKLLSDMPETDPIPEPFRLDTYAFDLPEALIAQEPPAVRGSSRLLQVDRRSGHLREGHVTDLPGLLRPGDVLVLNDTKVVKARVFGTRPDTAGRVEFLFLDIDDGAARALVKTRGKIGEGITADLDVASPGVLRVNVGPLEPGGTHRVETGLPAAEFIAALERVGRMPLPPYIRREREGDPRDAMDATRYQTVFAKEPGAAAAPTAGLQLTDAILDGLKSRGVVLASVTLHVGLGTFRPVETEDIRLHRMHEERWVVPPETAAAIDAARARGGRVIALGTTALRALAAAEIDGRVRAGAGSTRVFLHPPATIRAADGLFTNFHVPKSTLFMLVCAFAGIGTMKRAYAHAIARRWRMLSYGDAMLILSDTDGRRAQHD